MCLVILAHRCHARHPLLLAANRDEFYARPSAPATFWPEHPQLLAGRDLQAGGTWMGCTRQGRLAAITNYRDPARTAPAPRSRGELTLDFLTGSRSPGEYLQDIAADAGDYAGFNLLLGEGDQLWYYSNSSPDPAPRELGPGIYGLSNALLDTPWPKALIGVQCMRELLAIDCPDHGQLQQVVSGRELAQRDDLHPLGLDQEMDQLLSAQFITANGYGYGTRCTTTLRIDSDGEVSWREVSFDQEGDVTCSEELNFQILG